MSIVSIQGLTKEYQNGFRALKGINLEIKQGEIFALLGPNGAGKTSLISIICGLVNASAGKVLVNGLDNVSQYRAARQLIGLVPQELSTDNFETVWATVSFSRGLFGLAANKAKVENILRQLSLWDKKDNKIIQLSGGMKRRVMIAKALAHEPRILFLDEPTAGVDVELRRDMWQLVHELRKQGVTIILTTHYIEEAEQMADRIGVIQNGKLILVDEKQQLMQRLGRKSLTIRLQSPLQQLPEALTELGLELQDQGLVLTRTLEANDKSLLPEILQALQQQQLAIADLHTDESSLEDIFVDLVRQEQLA